MKQMLSPRSRLSQYLPVDGCRREAALRAGYRDRGTRIAALV
jgi:hypothetical protein